MSDLISREAAKLKVARVTWDDGDSSYDFHDKCVDCLDDLPSVETGKCGDCISREAAIYAVGYYSLHSDDKLLFADKPLKDLPSVEPERKTGHWHLLDECANEGWYCDQCNKKVFRADFSNTMKKYKFCPNCGAKMEVEYE